jgi:hypothetical protein
LTIRGGGNRHHDMAQMLTEIMGPPPRSFAADVHDCIMVRIRMDLPDTSSWREMHPPMANSPRIFTQTVSRRRQTPELRRVTPLTVHVPPRAQASGRCETQATLGGKPANVSVPCRFVVDSPLEGVGCEPSVPREIGLRSGSVIGAKPGPR